MFGCALLSLAALAVFSNNVTKRVIASLLIILAIFQVLIDAVEVIDSVVTATREAIPS